MRKWFIMGVTVGAVSLLSCSKSESNPDGGGESDPEAAAGTAGGGISIDATLTGKNAGTYKGETRELQCLDYGPLGLGILYMKGGDAPGKPGVLNRADFGIRSKSATPTDDFSITLTVYDADMQGRYRIDPKQGNGTGTAKVTGSGPEYTVTVNGKTAQGVSIDATLRCLK